MAGLSDHIEAFIVNLMEESDGAIEIQRNELAMHFECAPSQINYVLTTRFTPYKGYYIESRRGGGGYIRIVKVSFEKEKDLHHIIQNTIGDSITEAKAFDIINSLFYEQALTKREHQIVKAALSDRSFICDNQFKNQLRAAILKNILLVLAD